MSSLTVQSDYALCSPHLISFPTSSPMKTTTRTNPTSSQCTLLTTTEKNKLSRKDATCSSEEWFTTIDYLLHCEQKDSVMFYRLQLFMDKDLSQVLRKLADEIVCEQVLWMKKLPVYDLLSSATHTYLLTNKWHELMVLATSVHHAEIAHRKKNAGNLQPCQSETLAPIQAKPIETNLSSIMEQLHQYLTDVMKKEVTMQQLYQDVGDVLKRTIITMRIFEALRITKEEYVCLKVILLLSDGEKTFIQHLIMLC